jgi:hypothetical protein
VQDDVACPHRRASVRHVRHVGGKPSGRPESSSS